MFKNALKQNPKYKDSLIGLGKAFLEVEAYEQSYDLFIRALKIDGKSVDALVGLGKTLTRLGRYREAIEQFDKATRLSEDNLEAKYGTALLYHSMGKKIWARRILNNILKVNPFHYDSLLLMAEIKSSEKRLKEALSYVEKAIESSSESPLAYITSGEIMIRQYLDNENEDTLVEAKDSLSNALSIRPDSYRANRVLGTVALIENNYDQAISYFSAASSNMKNGTLLYSLAVAHDMAGNIEKSLQQFTRARKKLPSDSILRSRLEDFLVFRDIKIGNPIRVELGKEEHNLALNRAKKHMPDQVIMYLRRTLLMNPMNVEARELLMDYLHVQGFDRFYIDEMKELLRLFPGNKYRDKLRVAVIKRRDRLYHREGYSSELPDRDVPGVLVVGFDSDVISPHPDTGEVIASHLTFLLGQFGRMHPVGIRSRRSVSCGLKCGGDHLEQTMATVEQKEKNGEIGPVDYIIYGTYRERGNGITIEVSVMDFHKGFIIGEFTLTGTGKESLPKLALRSAKRIYSMVPFKGRVLKLTDNGIITNLGLFDGIKPGSKLVIYKFGNDLLTRDQLKRKIIFTVRESDTIISRAVPERPPEMDDVDLHDTVLPLKKRRAKKIE
jgi:tetratricopeptide (TPR) repeat protein